MSRSIAHPPHLAPPQVGVDGWLVRVRIAASTLLREWRVQRELRHLEELDAHALHDIGIGPGGLESAIRYGRRARPDLQAGRASLPPVMPASFTEWR